MNLTPADVRSLVIECLKKDRPFNPGTLPFCISFLCEEVAGLAKASDTEAYLRCLELPDAQEGMAAFAEKRKPRFQGK